MQILPDFWHLVEGLKIFWYKPEQNGFFDAYHLRGLKNILEICKIFRQLISEGWKTLLPFEEKNSQLISRDKKDVGNFGVFSAVD